MLHLAGAAGSSVPARIRKITVEGGSLSGGRLDVVVLEEVVLDQTKLAASLVLTGCLFDRVTLRGHVGSFTAWQTRWPGSSAKTEDRAAMLATFYAKVDWALDLTGATSGRIFLGDIPVELVRPNPELHFVLDREKADYDAIMKVEGVAYTMFANDVRELASGDKRSTLPMANPRSKSFPLDIAALRNPRRRGFVT